MLEYVSLSLSTFIAVRLEQYLKASGLIFVVALVMLMVVSASHFKKASLSIRATFLGILILVIPQSENAPAPISCISASGSNVTFCSFLQPMNALAAMLVTDLGMLNSRSSVRPAKTLSPIDCNLLAPLKLNAFSFLFVENEPLPI